MGFPAVSALNRTKNSSVSPRKLDDYLAAARNGIQVRTLQSIGTTSRTPLPTSTENALISTLQPTDTTIQTVSLIPTESALAKVSQIAATINQTASPSLLPEDKNYPPILMREVGGYPMRAHGVSLSRSAEVVYVSDNNGLTILNITDSLQPALIGDSLRGTVVISVTVLEQYPNLLCVASWNSGISLVDITNVAIPVLISTLPLAGLTRSITTLSHYPSLLAVACSDAGVSLINITNISYPFLVSTMTTGGPVRYVSGLRHYPNLLVAASGYGGVSFIDITNISSPSLISSMSTTGYVNHVAMLMQYPDLLVVAEGTAGISLVDITDIYHPTLISRIATLDRAWSITVLTRDLNLLAVSDNKAGISLVNITDVYHPSLLSNLWIPGTTFYTVALPKYANLILVANSFGIKTVEIRYTFVPQINHLDLKAIISTTGAALSVITLAQNPNLLAVACGYAGISLIDITNILYPFVVSSMMTKFRANHVAALAQYPNLLAVADGIAGISLINITDIYHPVLVSTTPTAAYAQHVVTLVQYPDLLAVADATYGTLACGVSLVDITNIYRPSLVNTLPIRSGAWSITQLARHPNLLVAPEGSITLVDITNISEPALAGTLPTAGGAAYVTIFTQYQHPNLLVIADNAFGVRIVDITNILRPILVSEIQMEADVGSITTLERYPNLLLVPNSYTGITLVDTTNLSYPVLVSNISTASSAYCITPLKQYHNLFVVADGDAGISIISISSLALWSSYLSAQKVGKSIAERLFVYADAPSELLKPHKSTVTFQQIVADGITRKDIPNWLNIDRELLALSGVPPKEVTGQHFAIELNFEATSAITKKLDSYKPLFRFDVTSSLGLNQSTREYMLLNQTIIALPTLAIDAIASLVTLTLTALPAKNVQFITTDAFGAIKPTFNFNTGVFQAFGAVQDLNLMLQSLRYVELRPNTSASTAIVVALDDAGLNYQTNDIVNMSFFRENRPPVCLINIITLAFEVKSNLDYTIPLGVCVDVDDSLDGSKLIYSAYSIVNSNATNASLALPKWMFFIPNQMRFSGYIQDAGIILIGINATDGYNTDTLTYKFILQRTFNQPPRAIKPITKLVVKTREITEYYFSPADHFVDPDGDDICVTFSSAPKWLTITPRNLTISSQNITANQTFLLIAKPKPIDTNALSDFDGLMTVEVSDPFNQTTTTPYAYAVGGASVVTLMISYGSTAIGVLGTVYGFYAYRNQIYNAVAWNRYRYKPTQFGREVDVYSLFAVPGGSMLNPDMQERPLLQDVRDDDPSQHIVLRWSEEAMPKLSDSSGDYYFQLQALSNNNHYYFSSFSNSYIRNRHEEITQTIVSFVYPLRDTTRYLKLKAKILNKIPTLFNGSFGKLLAKFGIQMNPLYFANFESVFEGLPQWLEYSQVSRVLRVVDVERDNDTPFKTPIVLWFMNDGGRILEEITFIVRYESSFESVRNGEQLEGIASRLAAETHTELSPVSPQADMASGAMVPSLTSLVSTRAMMEPVIADGTSPADIFADVGSAYSPFTARTSLDPPSTIVRADTLVIAHKERRRSAVADHVTHARGVHVDDLDDDEGTAEEMRIVGTRAETRTGADAASVTQRDDSGIGTSLYKTAGSFWGRYHISGLDRLLSLRLSCTAATVANTVVVSDSALPIEDSLALSDIHSVSVMPILYRAVDKPAHWVGLIINKAYDQSLGITYSATYIDPENNPIPRALVRALTQALPYSTLEQRLVKEQSSNNCGPELVEHFAAAITGHRVSEDLVPYFHSHLLEGFLREQAGYVLPTPRDMQAFRHVLDRHDITMSIRDALTARGFRQISLKLHPDRPSGNAEDFVFAQSLREKWQQDRTPKSILEFRIRIWQPRLLKATMAFKAIDITADIVTFYHEQTVANAQNLMTDSLHLYSMYSGITKFSAAATALSVVHAYYEGGLYPALQQASISLAYMAVPAVIAAVSPHAAFAYSAVLATHAGYNAIPKAYSLSHDAVSKVHSLYQSWNDVAHKTELSVEGAKPLRDVNDAAVNTSKCDSISENLALNPSTAPDVVEQPNALQCDIHYANVTVSGHMVNEMIGA